MRPNKVIQETIIRRAFPFNGEQFEICISADDEQWAANVAESAIAELRRIEQIKVNTPGKKYAAERVQLILQLNEVTRGVVKVPGVCITWGSLPNDDFQA